MKERRHSSAHALTSNVLHPDLASSLRAARALCIGIDLLLSESLAQHNQKKVPGVSPTPGAPANPNVVHTSLKLVFVEPYPSRTEYRLRREQLPPPGAPIKRPVVRVFPTEGAALAYAAPYAAKRASHVVVTNSAAIPTSWVPW
jgi:hypothetical protein